LKIILSTKELDKYGALALENVGLWHFSL